MNFENHPNLNADIPSDHENGPEVVSQSDAPHESKQKGLGAWIKKNAALAGIVGLGIGMTAEAEAKPFHPSKGLYPTDSENYLIERIGNEKVEGKVVNIYIVKDLTTGAQKKFNADSDKEARLIGPIYVQPLKKWELEAIETERAFKQSGLSNEFNSPNPNYEIRQGNHTEMRHFKGYGIETDTKVEVTSDGKIVRTFEANAKPFGEEEANAAYKEESKK